MKAEHRKELETNALAEGMGRMIRGMRERPQRRGVVIWAGVIVVLLGLGIWWWYDRIQRDIYAEGWAKLDVATSMFSAQSPDAPKTAVVNFAFKLEQGEKPIAI